MVVVTKIMTFFQKCVQIDLDFCCGDLRSVGATYALGLYQPAGWLAAAARWATTVSRLKPPNQAVAAQRAATACIIYRVWGTL